MNKLCFGCKHFYWSRAYAGYSEMTPGSEFSVSCNKDIWRFNAFETSQHEFEEMINTAKTCNLFELRDELKNKNE